MKSVNAAVSTAIRQAHNVYVQPRLTAEWNMNRYGNPTANNIPAEDTDGYDVEYFPVESIILPNRPTRGINKARVTEARVREIYEGKQESRYYVSSPDDIYKYWTSPVQSSGATFPNASDGRTKARPHVTYSPSVQANKIVIKLENSWATPSSFQVLVKTNAGDAWNYASPTISNPPIDSKGQITLYHQGNGVWSTNFGGGVKPLATVGGIMLKVDSMMRSNSYLSVIEISARRYDDLTDYLISAGDTFDVAEHSNIYPIGVISANTSNVTLSNVDGRFNNDNSSSPYFGIIEPNVEFNLEYVYNVNNVEYPVQQFRMYVEAWGGQTNETADVSLFDYSKYFQEVKPLPAMYQSMTASEIIWRLCDQVGFSNYEISLADEEAQPIINIFWVTGEKTLFEILDEVSRATQTAIYFDEYGTLRVLPRTVAYDNAKTPVWTLRANESGADLPDIVEVSQEGETGANHVVVNYQTTEWSDFNKGFPKMERVWEPEGSLVLRASPLVRTLDHPDAYLWIASQDADVWPYTGIAQVQGELIRYNGKQYIYSEGGVQKKRDINSQAEKEKVDALSDASVRYQNHFTGGLKIEERGLWNSEKKRHPVEAEGYGVRSIVGGTKSSNTSGFSHVRQESVAKLQSSAKFTRASDLLVATRGQATDQGYYFIGARLKFNREGQPSQRAGIVFNSNGANEDGYYVEIQPTDKVDRLERHELIFFSRKNGTSTRVGGDQNMGVPLFIRENVFYDLDVSVSGNVVNIMVNGVHCMSVTVPSSLVNSFGGRFGMHVRGHSSASYEYLYAVNRLDNQLVHDQSTFYDRINGGYTGNQWDREWVYKWHKLTRRQKKGTERERARWRGQFMDEFGPIVHEVREFDVKFDPAPVLHSRLFFYNDYQVVCTEYSSDSFGAKFILANAYRENAVVHGEDKLTYAGSGVSINQILLVYGRAVVIRESEKIEVRNEAQIRARGRIEAEITSDWIQSKDAAQHLAKWIGNHWGGGADEVQATIFGNPLLELGDVVAVDHPELGMYAASHRYFITGISTDYDSGLETVLTLRRVL